jgi:sec-independent protein translocase protein TatB
VLLGKAQRYVAQVQNEVSRSIELEELKKVKTHVEDAARNMERSMHDSMDEASALLNPPEVSAYGEAGGLSQTPYYSYSPPVRKNWRLKRGAMPLWYKQKNGVRRHAQSGAARVARFRPPSSSR